MTIDAAMAACEHLCFASSAQRNAAMALIGEHLRAATSVIKESLPETNAYVAGSLSRGEPSLRMRGDTVVGLQSDLDFIIVGKVSGKKLLALKRRLDAMFSDFSNTFIAYTPERIAELRSPSARDLHLALRHPLYETFAVPEPKPFALTPEGALEVIVNRIVPVLANRLGDQRVEGNDTFIQAAGVWSRETEYARHKLAVESLRFAGLTLGGSFEEIATFHAVHRQCGVFPLRTVAPEERVRDLLRRRELWDGEGIAWSSEFAEIVHASLAVIVGMPGASPAKIIDRLTRAYYTDVANILHLVPLAAIVAFYAACGIRDADETGSLADDLLVRVTLMLPSEKRGLRLGQAMLALCPAYIRTLIADKERGGRS